MDGKNFSGKESLEIKSISHLRINIFISKITLQRVRWTFSVYNNYKLNFTFDAKNICIYEWRKL